jgi:hypothetical protein
MMSGGGGRGVLTGTEEEEMWRLARLFDEAAKITIKSSHLLVHLRFTS